MPEAAAAPMRMFVWNDPYDNTSRGDGGCVAYAIAPDADAARASIRQARIMSYGKYHDNRDRPEFDIDREPDRVFDGTGAEIYAWEE